MTTKQYDISFLIPIYGVERYIEQCATSLLSQGHAACQFIFVDDCSQDRSMERLEGIIERFEARREDIIIVRHEQNQGLAAARASALQHAEGKYIAFVDSDDYIVPDFAQAMLKRTAECSDEIISGHFTPFTDRGMKDPVITPHIPSRVHLLRMLLAQSHLVKNHIHGRIYLRDIFVRANITPTPGIDMGEDYLLLSKLLYHAQSIGYVERSLYRYRLDNDGSYMNTISEARANSYVHANQIVTAYISAQGDAWRYRRALSLGKLNIKKWILRRGLAPKEFDAALFEGEPKRWLRNPLLRLYNRTIDSGCVPLARVAAAVANLKDAIYCMRF